MCSRMFKDKRSSYVMLTLAFLLQIALWQNVCCDEAPTVSFSTHDLNFELADFGIFAVQLSEHPNETIEMLLVPDDENAVCLDPSNLNFTESGPLSFNVTVTARRADQLTITIENTSYFDNTEGFTRVKINVHDSLDVLDDVLGWLYFVAWSVSFYPQIWINFRRRSVIGLNLDFVTLNVVGFFCYSMYNCGLRFIPEIKSEYFKKHPHGVMPVQIQDVVFALHALFASCLTGIEALIFDRGPQRISRICLAIHSAIAVFLTISLILSCTDVITWLDYLYYFSYVKLAITIIKYCPQAYFNFRRKSTKGWSIGNILLDFTGGALSMIQMFIIAYNYDDWSSLFGDPTKFGLSLFSILFDVLFIVQHYILYRNAPSSKYDNIDDQSTETPAL